MSKKVNGMSRDDNFKEIDEVLSKTVAKHISQLAQFYAFADYAHDWVLFHKSLKDWSNFMSRHYDELDEDQQSAVQAYFWTRINIYYSRVKDDVLPKLSLNNHKLLAFVEESKQEIMLFAKYNNAQLTQNSKLNASCGSQLLNQVAVCDKYQTYAWQQTNNATTDF